MQFIKIFVFLVVLVALTGCMGTSLLSDDEYLLRKQKIKGVEQLDQKDLAQFYRQEPNKKIPLIPFAPYVWFYEIGLANYDADKIKQKKEKVTQKFNKKIARNEDNPSKIAKLQEKKSRKLDKLDKVLEDGNMFMRWGEPLAIFDRDLSESSSRQMTLYLKTKGFFDAEADFTTTKSNKKVKVTYQIQEGEPFLYDTIIYKTTNRDIAKIIQESLEESYLQKDERYDEANLVLERERIEELLKNHGYYDFSRQYVNYKIYDTTDLKRLSVETIINNPKNREHRVFKIDSVIFVTDEGRNFAREDRSYKAYNGVTYKFYDEKYSKKMLDRRLFIYPDSLYSIDNTIETQRQLANLDMFKFVNVYYDTVGSRFNANIFTSPLKKYQTTNEIGLGIILSQGFPGPYYNLSVKNRNVFGGLEIMEVNGRIGIEGVPAVTDARQVYSSTEARANFSLIFPQFLLPLSSGTKSMLGEYNPKTRALAGYSFTNRPEYLRSTFNMSLSYNWQPRLNTAYNFTITDLNLIYTPRLDSVFSDYLIQLQENGNNLINSFNTSFVSSMIFSAIFNFNRYGSGNENASYLKLSAENGGATWNFLDPGILEDLNLEYYQFIKIDADYRRYLPVEQNSLAYRLHFGMAIPYGNNDILPYEKYFFAGGSSSIRAWRPRRLGPGSYRPLPDEDGFIDDRFEQQAEIILESSIELRRKLIGFLDGAVFVDAGNTWTIQEETLRPGANFELNRFFKEIAIGSGLGLRFDFSFLLVRLDAGLKVYDPARSEGKRFILNKGFNDKPFQSSNNIIFNIGIGYPF